MAELIKLEYKTLPELYVVGAQMRVNMNDGTNPIPAFWGKCFNDGIFKTFDGRDDIIFENAFVGYMDEWNQQTGEFSYICGVMLTELPDGIEKLTVRKLQPCTVADGYIKGIEEDVYMNAHRLTEEAFSKDGKTADFSSFWCSEVYPENFDKKDEQGRILLNYFIPVKN